MNLLARALTMMLALAHPEIPAMEGGVVHYSVNYNLHNIARFHGVTVPFGYVPIAHWDKTRLGHRGTLSVAGESFRVVGADYTHLDHVAWVRRVGIMAELDYTTAEALGIVYAGGRMEGSLRWDR